MTQHPRDIPNNDVVIVWLGEMKYKTSEFCQKWTLNQTEKAQARWKVVSYNGISKVLQIYQNSFIFLIFNEEAYLFALWRGVDYLTYIINLDAWFPLLFSCHKNTTYVGSDAEFWIFS